MAKKANELEGAITIVHDALNQVVSKSSEKQVIHFGSAYRTIAKKHLRNLAQSPYQVHESVVKNLVSQSTEIMSLANRGNWRETLTASHKLLSSLEGEPGSDPIEVPPLPW